MRTLTSVAAILVSSSAAVYAQSATGRSAEDLIERGVLDSAEVLVATALATDTGDSHAIYLAGRIEMARGNHDAAFARFERATELRPATAEYHYWLGRAYHERMEEAGTIKKMGLARGALGAFRTAVHLDPELLDARVWLINYLWRAPGIVGGDREEAMRHLDQLARRDRLQSVRLEGSLRFEDKDYRLAAQAYREIVRLDSASVDARFMLGRIAQETTQWDAAIRWFSAAIERDSTALGIWYQLGRTGALSGVHADIALNAMTRYITDGPAENGPNLASAYWRRGMIFERLHRTQDAAADYRRALALEPGHEQARKALDRLPRNE